MNIVVTQTTINASVVDSNVSVAVTQTPISVTVSPVDINSHVALTLGTANGLSLSGQVLSLGLASASVAGALSGADWTTFNNKQNALGFTPVNIASAEWIDLTDGGATSLHSHAGGSVAWGSITGTLSNQTDLQTALDAKLTAANNLSDLASASTARTNLGLGAIALEASPLAASKGGTGIANAGTLTNASNTTITGGGTLALGGFTLTVPATGTAALLATANVFTAAQTVTIASVADVLALNANHNEKAGLRIKNSSAGINAQSRMVVVNDVNTEVGFTCVGSTFNNTVYRNNGVLTSMTSLLFLSNSETASGGTGTISFYTGGYNNAAALTINASGSLSNISRTATTNAIVEAMQLLAQVSTAANGSAAGFGTGLSFYAETVTNNTNQQQGLISTSWIDATNASRKAKMSLSAYDTAARLGIEIEASGTVAKLGFFGVATVVRPAALTTQLTAITFTAPTPDYAIQDLTNVAPFGFVTKDEGNTVLSVIANLQTRVGELETKLQALGLLT